ncbi:hypothetical protein [Suipraeoptans intestinalis]|uniref:hypothetical protein n=1 Tax=Suipraeoptans intestinalis TaxID=2606628 RepID=UPI0022A65C41|nr:hypothetical protein [Suipraeoptans intestinalis]
MGSPSIWDSSGSSLSRPTTVSRIGGACDLFPGRDRGHTGDFKVDYTPVFGDAIDLQRFGEIGKKGVLALMSDSTNAERKGFTPVRKDGGDHL